MDVTISQVYGGLASEVYTIVANGSYSSAKPKLPATHAAVQRTPSSSWAPCSILPFIQQQNQLRIFPPFPVGCAVPALHWGLLLEVFVWPLVSYSRDGSSLRLGWCRPTDGCRVSLVLLCACSLCDLGVTRNIN